MKHTQEEIIKALQIIADECFACQNCEDCPFIKDDKCVLEEERPVQWRLNDPMKWKAIL